MHTAIIATHSLLRWVLLALLVLVAVRAIVGWRRDRPFASADRRLGLALIITVDVQFLLGLLLYGVLSPVTRRAMADFGSAMSDRLLRFWAVEHASLALLAVMLLHIGRILVRRSTTDRQRHRRMMIAAGIALLLLLAAIPWPFVPVVGRPLIPGG